MPNNTMQAVRLIIDELYELLNQKNESYGDSATNPIRIFSRNSTEEQILVRIDDKLSRIARGNEYPGDDTLKDLTGYFILLLAQRILPPPNNTPPNTPHQRCQHTHHTQKCDNSPPLHVIKVIKNQRNTG